MNTFSPVSKFKKWMLFLLALSCSLGTVSLSRKICDQYYSVQAYAPDPIGEMLKCAEYKHRLATESRWALAGEEFRLNPTDPFAIIPIVLIAPSMLDSREPHLFVVFPCFLIFLFLMGYIILYRGHSFLIAASVIVCYSTSLVLFAGYFGLSFFLKDNIASYPLAIAAICLWLWYERRGQKNFYLIFFALSVGFAVLCRYAVSVYAFILFCPLLLYALYVRFKEMKNFFEAIVKPLLVISSILLLVCGYFLIKNYKDNVDYYSYWLSLEGVTMKVGIFHSFKTFLVTYFGYFALYHSLLVLIVVLFGMVLFLKAERKFKYEYLLDYWFVVALPLYWIIILQTDGQKLAGAFTIGFPVMFFGIFAGARAIENANVKKVQTIVACMVLLVSLASLPRTIAKCSQQAAVVTTEEAAYRDLTVKLASFMVHSSSFSEQKTLVSDFAGEYVMSAATLESKYQWGVYFPYVKNGKYLAAFNEQLGRRLNADSLTADIKDNVFQKVTTNTNVIITFENNQNRRPLFTNKLLNEMASYMNERMKNSIGWTKNEVESDYGIINIYSKAPL